MRLRSATFKEECVVLKSIFHIWVERRNMATLGLSKVFILDKYFTELQKFWETEKKLQGKYMVCIDSMTLQWIRFIY